MRPKRWVENQKTRAQYGERVDRLADFLTVVDPLADAAAAELYQRPAGERDRSIGNAARLGPGGVPRDMPKLAALAERCHHVPFWFDRARAERGGAVFLRSGLAGGLALAFRSLILGYCSPAGNKPLAFSGRLERDVPRRLLETSRFVHAVCSKDGLLAGGPGFNAAFEVRLMHAGVRSLLLRSGRWNDDWGAPINQLDMAGTVLLFSSIVLEGLEKLGVRASAEEAEDFLHLWRYVGFLLGVEEELLCANRRDAQDLWAITSSTQAPPDEDARTLARALLESRPADDSRSLAGRRAEHLVPFAYELSRYLIGERGADLLGYPRSAWALAPPVLTLVIGSGDSLLRFLPLGDRLGLQIGLRYWSSIVGMSAPSAIGFAFPSVLGGLHRHHAA